MSRHRPVLLAAALLSALSAGAFVQSAISVRAVSAPVGTDSGLLATVTSVRPLSDGRVLVNDQDHRRLLLFDTTLAHYTVVMDTAQGAKDKYGVQRMFMYPYIGDSTALLDIDARVFVIVSPSGAVAHAMAMPRSNQTDVLVLVGAPSSAFDAYGRLIFRVGRSRPPGQSMPAVASKDSGTFSTDILRDSLAIIRVDPDTKAVDTLGVYSPIRAKLPSMSLGRGYSYGPSATNPYPDPDDWVVFADGTVAIVRGHDYHVDWISPGLTTTSTRKLPFDWKRIPEEEKQKKSDSLRAVAEARAANRPAPAPPLPGRGGFTQPQFPPVWFEPSEMPDYYPVIRAGTTKADPEGNVWLLPTTSMLAGQGLVYDVVNRKGELFERVRIPEGRNLIAVGRNGIVYMSYTPKGGLIRLERARVLR